jgi:penicillin-binding protein 2
MNGQNQVQRAQRTITRIHKIDEIELFFLKRRLEATTGFILVMIVFLILRLWFLQVHKGYEFEERAKDNRGRELRVLAPRGNLLDRRGRLLITNRPSFAVVWTRDDAPNPDEVIKKLARILGDDIEILLDRIREQADNPRYLPLRLKEDIDWKTLVYIENNHFNLPGVRIEVLPARNYLHGDLASHLIGYLGQISREELLGSRLGAYEGGDPIGKQGLEKLLEPELRGELGHTLLEVDAHGFEKKQVATQEPLPGNDVYLTIDQELQKVAETALVGQAGAVVASEVNSGRLLVLASSPALRLEEFVGGISQKNWREMLDNPLRPLTNKAIQGQYPPASTYKIVTALAALGEGAITPETTLHCGGSLAFGNRRYNCWKRSGHGAVNLKKALAESCDVYFYQVIQKLNVDTLAGYAKSLGFGRKTGILLEHEKGGLVPTAAWKKEIYREAWQEGESLAVAIGQGFNLATPLQVNRMMAAVANGGVLHRPQLIEKIVDPDGRVVQSFETIRDGEFKGREIDLELVRKGLIAAIHNPGGTAERIRIKGLTVAGKTGTAQVVHRSQVEHITDENQIPYRYRDHAWFTCYAPAEKPEIAVTVLIEHGKHGSSAAAPVARRILIKYFGIPEESAPPPSVASEGD